MTFEPGPAIDAFLSLVNSVGARFVDMRAFVDIAIVAVVLYWLLTLISGTSAFNLVRGILILLTLGFGLSYVFNLTMLGFLLRTSIPALIFVVPVLFAPEIRRALEQLGRAGTLLPRTTVSSPSTRLADTVARAAQQLSDRRFGALLIIERATPLGEYAASGVSIDGLLSVEVLLNIFWPNTPLHDGAVIIHGDRIVSAAVVLPLAQSPTAEHLGTRHRAAIGITEISDAIAVVVSEETGRISIANAGRMVRNLGQSRLQKVLSILDRAPTGITAPATWRREPAEPRPAPPRRVTDPAPQPGPADPSTDAA